MELVWSNQIECTCIHTKYVVDSIKIHKKKKRKTVLKTRTNFHCNIYQAIPMQPSTQRDRFLFLQELYILNSIETILELIYITL